MRRVSPVASARCAVLALACLLVHLALSATTATAQAPQLQGAERPRVEGPGHLKAGSIVSRGSKYPYLRYVPRSYSRRRPAPLVVVAHGCQTTARQMMGATAFNRLAERKRFVVLYPDVDALSRALPGPLKNCWKFFDPTSYFRGNSDPAAIAAMTRAVMGDLRINPQRVYIVGTSAGGLMAAVNAAAYSDLYAAAGIVAAAGFADGTCFTTGIGTPAELNAALAHSQMGPRARVVPLLAIGGDADLAFPLTCTNKAIAQGLRTNNLVLSGSQEGPLALRPAATWDRTVPGGRPYTVSAYRDPNGCLVAKRIVVHGMPHAWPGGTKRFEGWTDPPSPDGARASWAFFKRYRKGSTGMPCAEARPPGRGGFSEVTSVQREAWRFREQCRT